MISRAEPRFRCATLVANRSDQNAVAAGLLGEGRLQFVLVYNI